MQVEGLCGGGVVASSFGNVKVAGVLDGVDDGRADGGQVDWAVAGAAGAVGFTEADVPHVVLRLNRPLLTGESGQIGSGGLGTGEIGDQVDRFAGDLRGDLVLPPPGDLDGLTGVREVQVIDMHGLHGAGLDPAMPGLPGGCT